jgi:hypothetical protein
VTCRNSVPAGRDLAPDRVDTEVVAQRRPTVLKGVEPQVGGVMEGDSVLGLLPDHFSIMEVLESTAVRVVCSDSFPARSARSRSRSRP